MRRFFPSRPLARRWRAARCFARLLAAALVAWPAAARTRSEVPPAATAPVPLRPRVEDHAGFGRLIMPAPGRGGYHISRQGDTLILEYPPSAAIADVARPPRNVVAISAGPGATRITLLAGAQVRTRRAGTALVIDFLQPPLPPSPRSVPPPAPVAVPAVAPAPPPPEPPVAPPPAAPSPAPPVQNTNAIPDAPANEKTVAIEAVAGDAPTILLPAARDTGLAAWREGPEILVVLDAPIAFQSPASLPPGAGLDPVFSRLTSRRGQDATVIHLPLAAAPGAPPDAIRFARAARGWLVTAAPPADPIAGIVPTLAGDGANATLRLPASAPGRVVTVRDPRTGADLLVGTQTLQGEAVTEARQQVQFSLPPTLQGVVVAPVSDDLTLRREDGGFALAAGPHAGGGIIVADGAAPPAEASDNAPRSQVLDLPAGTAAALARQLAEQIDFAATAPALARAAPRLRVAATMIALGMGVEAQSVLDVAAAGDPALKDTPKFIGFRAVASILADRLDDAAAIADPRLAGSTEIAFWHALLRLAQGQPSDQPSGRDGRDLAAAMPLLLAYPAPLRERLLPRVLEAMALGGQAPAAQAALKTLPDGADQGGETLDLARGMALEMTNQPDAALRQYDTVAGRADRLPSYTARVRAAELRLKRGTLDASAAADALDKALFGWRGARQEQALRLRIAALRRQAGQWRDALAVLRGGQDAFPDDHAAIDRAIGETFAALFAGDAARRMTPADFVALYDQNADLVKATAWPETLGMTLVDRLVDLGLQGRAEPVLAGLVARSADPARRVVLGARLAALRLSLDDPAGAIDALAQTAPAGAAPGGIAADPAVMRTRQFLYASAEAARGNTDAALAMFAALPTAEADEARADIYAARKDWPRVTAALDAAAARRITAPDTLTEAQQALVMRLAQAASLGGDSATLARLGARYGAAMARGGSAALFRLMTSAPVQGTKDLPRAYEEIQLARKLPGGLLAAAP